LLPTSLHHDSRLLIAMAFPNPEPHHYYLSQYPQYPQYPQEKHSNYSLQDSHGYSQQHSAPPQFPQHSAPQFPQDNAPQFPQPNVTHYEQHALPHHHSQYPGNASHYPPQNSSWYPSQNGSNPFVKLSFSNRTTVNTSITVNGTPYYKISTVDTAGAVTNIKNPRTCALISTINRRTLHPDSVTFAQRYDGRALKVKEWLVKSIEESVTLFYVLKSSELLLTESMRLSRTKWTIQTGGTTLTFLWDISNRLVVSLSPAKLIAVHSHSD
jgi:hypothetical protein